MGVGPRNRCFSQFSFSCLHIHARRSSHLGDVSAVRLKCQTTRGLDPDEIVHLLLKTLGHLLVTPTTSADREISTAVLATPGSYVVIRVVLEHFSESPFAPKDVGF